MAFRGQFFFPFSGFEKFIEYCIHPASDVPQLRRAVTVILNADHAIYVPQYGPWRRGQHDYSDYQVKRKQFRYYIFTVNKLIFVK